jgi:hypothetical protein
VPRSMAASRRSCAICAAGNPRGGCVEQRDGTSRSHRFPASGLRLVNLDDGVDRGADDTRPEEGEGGHRWPEFVPHANAVAFVTGTATARTWDEGDIVVQSLDTGERRTLLQGNLSSICAVRSSALCPRRDADGRAVRCETSDACRAADPR